MGLQLFDQSTDPYSIRVSSSQQTIYAMVNSMVGGIVLLLPLMVLKCGFLLSIVIIIGSGLISNKTFQILIKNLQPYDFDIQHIIQRIMGNKWMILTDIISFIYLFFVCILYYYLIVTSIFSISVYSITKINNNDNKADYNCCADPKEITFEKFSESWVTLLIFLPMMALLFIKDYKQLVKMSEMGVYAIFAYVFFILYLTYQNMEQIVYYWDNKYLYEFQSGELMASIFLGYQIQNTSLPIMKLNKDQNQNKRDTNITYLIGCCIYTVIGILGGLTALVLSQGNFQDKDNILDLFEKTDLAPVIIEILYLGHLISMYPIFWQLTKSRIYGVIFDGVKSSKIIDTCFNIVFLIFVSFLKNIPSIDITTITGINGSFSCFFIVILIPICLEVYTWKSQSKIVGLFRNLIKFCGYNQNYEKQQEQECQQFMQNNDQNQQQLAESQINLNKNKSYNIKLFLNILIILIGLYFMIYGLYISIHNVEENIKQQQLKHKHQFKL